MGLMWFIIGCLVAAIAMGAYKLWKNGANWKTFLPGFLGVAFFLFGLAWSVSSAIEGEPQSAAMGLVFFGIPGILLVLLGYRLFTQKV